MALFRGGGLLHVDAPAAAKYSSSCFAYLKEHAYQPSEDMLAPSDIIQKPNCFGTLAAYITGFLLKDSIGVEQDASVGFKYIQVAVIQGNMFAQTSFGLMYKTGAGDVQKDFDKALQYYRLAAAQNYAVAQFNIGNCYWNGNHVQSDKREAFKFYKLASDQGYEAAMCQVGLLTYNGNGVTRDTAQGKKILQDAAARGSEKAEEYLQQIK